MVGVYLQGSFAMGDADVYSDCDFLIPVHVPVTPKQEAGLRALHDEIPTRRGHWTHHLEGSYPVKDQLRSLHGLGEKWLYTTTDGGTCSGRPTATARWLDGL